MRYDYTSDDYDPQETARRRLAQFDESIDTGTPYMALGLSALVHALVDLGSNLTRITSRSLITPSSSAASWSGTRT